MAAGKMTMLRKQQLEHLSGCEAVPVGILRPSLFWTPQHLNATSTWVAHIPFAFWLVDVLRPSRFVELGTHHGVSYMAFCQAIQKLGYSSQAYAVDTWSGDEHAGHYGEEVVTRLRERHDRLYATFSTLVRSKFDDAAPYFEQESIDLLHIDGLHTYDAVRHDFEVWKPKLTRHAIVLFHDTNVIERKFGVRQFFDELRRDYRGFEFLHGCGLGVIAVSDAVPPELDFLLRSSDEPSSIQLIRTVFQSRGQHCELLAAGTLPVETESAETAALINKNTTLQAELQETRANLGRAEARVAQLDYTLQTERAEIERLQAHKEQRRKEIEEAEADASRRRGEIGRLRNELEHMRAEAREEIEEARGEACRQRGEITRLKGEFEHMRAEAHEEIEEARGEACRQRGEIVRLKSELEQMHTETSQTLKELELSQIEVSKLDEEMQLLQNQLEGWRVGCEQARTEAMRIRSDNARSHAEISSAQAKIAGLEVEQSEARKAATNAEIECSRVRAQLDQSMRAYTSVVQSTTWRATAPLRNLANKIPHSLRLLARRAVATEYLTVNSSLSNTRSPDGTIDQSLRSKIERVGLFDPTVYLDLNLDVKAARDDPWQHFMKYGLREGRHFTTSELVARAIAKADPQIRRAAAAVRQREREIADDNFRLNAAQPFLDHQVRVGIFCNSLGNFFMQEIANLLAWQLHAFDIDVHMRSEVSQMDEHFDLRIFVAPHEFFYLGRGPAWKSMSSADGSVLYNVEQMQTQWFCRAFPLFLEARLVLDINFQSTELLRQMGCNAVHYMPPYLTDCPYTRPQPDVSGVEIVRGYEFSRTKFTWTEHVDLSSRPIDILFIGTGSARRSRAIERLRELGDKHRFICIYTHQSSPLTPGNYRTTSTEINCALAQRSKITLNIHRDWIGYFEWSRMVLQGFWQGACVVSDPSLQNPYFREAEHFLEENVRHMPELLRWLLETRDGHAKMNDVSVSAHKHARSPTARVAMLLSLLSSLRAVLNI
jgi:hypothetical protein